MRLRGALVVVGADEDCESGICQPEASRQRRRTGRSRSVASVLTQRLTWTKLVASGAPAAAGSRRR